jgi:hypothetical protein
MVENPRERKWILSIPFKTAPVLSLTESRTLSFGEMHAELLPAPTEQARILLSDLESEHAARRIFESLLTGLAAASLNVGWGIRVRRDVTVLSDTSPIPSEVDRPLIYPEGKDMQRLLMLAGTPTRQLGKVLPKLETSLGFGLSSKSARAAMDNDRVRLALDLYNDSYFEASESAQFLSLVGVLEILKDRDASSSAAQVLVDEWIHQARILDDNEAASIQGSLNFLKKTSISRGIGSLIKRHLGPDRAIEAQDLYHARSKLVHDGTRLTDPAGTVRRIRQIVMDLLAQILVTGSL